MPQREASRTVGHMKLYRGWCSSDLQGRSKDNAPLTAIIKKKKLDKTLVHMHAFCDLTQRILGHVTTRWINTGRLLLRGVATEARLDEQQFAIYMASCLDDATRADPWFRHETGSHVCCSDRTETELMLSRDETAQLWAKPRSAN